MTAPTIGASVVGGTISPGEVLARAQFWTTQPPGGGYNQGSSAPDPDGKLYRSDCSGYVSMCWHLASSANTASIPGFTQLIDPSQLQPGDVMNASSAMNGGSGHVVLFDHWVDGHSSYFGHEFGSGASPKHHVIPYPYFAYDHRVYRPYHYPKLAGSFTPDPYPPIDDGGGGGGVVIGIPTRVVYDVPGSYTWTKPATGTWVRVWAVGGGGGGGLGTWDGFYVLNPGSPDNLIHLDGYVGGGGGGGAAYLVAEGRLADLDATVPVRVGYGTSDPVLWDGTGEQPVSHPSSGSSFGVAIFAGQGLKGGDGGPGGRTDLNVGAGGDGAGDEDGDHPFSLDAGGWTGVFYAGQDGASGQDEDHSGHTVRAGGGTSGSAGQPLPAGITREGGGGGAGGLLDVTDFPPNDEHLEPVLDLGDGGADGWVVVETGGDFYPVGPDLRPPDGDNGNTPLLLPATTVLRYLRMTQRNDTLGVQRSPRLANTGSNNPTSRALGTPRRLGVESNTYL